MPTDYEFENGFFGFTIENVGIGEATTVTIYLPDGAAPEAYYKYGPEPGITEPHWYEFMYDDTTATGAVILGNVITLHFVDGQRGDDDLTENGTIVDDGGPGFSTASVPTESGLVSSGGSSGGGCFIEASSSGLSTTSFTMMVVIFCTSLFGGLIRSGRKS